MKDQTIESLPKSEREAAEYHVKWATNELGSEELACDFVTLVLKTLGPQLRPAHQPQLPKKEEDGKRKSEFK